MNKPYVKEYTDGEVSNPIETGYFHKGANRAKRREPKQKHRFHGNGKNTPLVLLGALKYKKRVQMIEGKRIEHYDLIKN